MEEKRGEKFLRVQGFEVVFQTREKQVFPEWQYLQKEKRSFEKVNAGVVFCWCFSCCSPHYTRVMNSGASLDSLLGSV